MRLALELKCTLAELCGRMSPGEFALWLARDSIEPLPRPWLQTARLESALWSLLGSGRRRHHPEDFMPVRRSRRRQSAEEMMAAVAAVGARIGRQSRGEE